MIPPHRSFALLSKSKEDFVSMTPLHMAYFDRCGIYDGTSYTLSRTINFLEQCQLKSYHLLLFYEAVVGQSFGKMVFSFSENHQVKSF